MKKRLLSTLLVLCMLISSTSLPVFAASIFPDIGNYSIHYKAVAYVSSLGIMVGDEYGNFLPDKTVTRAEMAAIMCRLMDQTENLLPSDTFSDVPRNYWANAYITKAAELGIVSGVGNGMFVPNDSVTCEQALTMVIRATGRGAHVLGGYPDGYLDLAEQSGIMRDVEAKKGESLSRLDIAVIIYNCMANHFNFPLTGYTLVDCSFYRTYYTDNPNSRHYNAPDRCEYGGIDVDIRLGEAHLILIDSGLRKSTDGLIFYPSFMSDKLNASVGEPIIGPYWMISAGNCPSGAVLTGVKNDNGGPVRVLGDELNFYLNGNYDTLDFDIGPCLQLTGNSYDDVRIYLDEKEAAYFNIPYDSVAQHCTLDVTGVTTITFRVNSKPEYDPDTIVRESNKIIICNTKLK